MHVVNLQVIASVRIKRRKPWKRFAWIGKTKESVLMLEDHRVSVLFIPSGNTKRKISKLSPILKDCVSLNYAQECCFVIGLLRNGTIFSWNKDMNEVSTISSIPDLKSRSFPSFKWRPLVFMDDCGHHVVAIVVTPTTTMEIFVWKRSSFSEVADRWWRIEGSNVDSRCGIELASDVCFANDDILGHGVRCAFVFTRGTFVCFVALNVMWPTTRLAPIVHRWSNVTFPFERMSPTARASKRKGSYVVRWSRDACVAAVVVNQDSAEDGRILFVSVNCEVLVVSRLYVDDCERYDENRFLHWICDASWTNNDLFLVTVNRLGSVCLLSRLGEPLTIATHGCSMDLSPSRSLSIHPFVFVRNSTVRNDEDSMTTTSGNVLKQRFSVCCHPRRPVFLCSDGYLVTCLQLPNLLADLHRAVYVFLRESQKSLKQLKRFMQQQRGAVATSSGTPMTKSFKSDSAFRRSFGIKEPPVVFWEEPQSENTDSSVDHSVRANHHYSAIGNENQGVLTFGTLNSTTGLHSSIVSNEILLSDAISDAQKETLGSLFCAWTIIVTTNDTWTIEWENRAKSVTELFVKLCSMYAKQLSFSETSNRSESVCSPIDEIIAVLDRFLLFCRFDGIRKNTMPVVIGVVRTVFGRVLLSAVRDLPPRIGLQCLDAITALLASASDTIISTFSWNENKLILYQVGQSSFEDVYSATSIGQSVRKTRTNGRKDVGCRLISVWRRLYRVTKRIHRNLESTYEKTNVASILCRIESQIQLLGHPLEKAEKVKVTAEQRKHLLVPSDRITIAAKWWHEAEKMIRDENATRKTSKLLHSILYSYLEGYHLEEAIGFIRRLVAFERNEGLKHEAIRLTVRSFARFMSMYFMGILLAIYPWHHPRPLRRLNGRERADRFLFLDRDHVVSRIRNESASEHWSASVSIALLLSTGCLKEAADLARHLGDWKSSFVISIADSVVLNRSTSQFCEEFLQSHVCQLIGLEKGSDKSLHGSVSDVALPTALEDCFLAGVLCGLEIVPSICKSLLNEMKMLVRKLDSVLVPEDIYIPRPPIYCPQLKDPLAEEDHVVARIASVLRLVRIVLCSSQCHVHVVHSYVSQLSRISQMMSFNNAPNSTRFPLDGMLQRLEDQISYQTPETSSVSGIDLDTMVQCFRDICSLSWFMNVRDKTSRYFRKFRQSIDAEKVPKTKVMSKTCGHVLHWGFHLFPFVELMEWNLEVYNLMLSVLLEMPADEKASAVLAKLFPDMTEIPDELNYRINRLLSVWRTSTVEIKDCSSVRSKRKSVTKTLSVIHLEQCHQMKNDAVHKNVAVGPLEKSVLMDDELPSKIRRNARPFEMEKDYYEFLELLFDVGFLKDGIDTEQVPLFTSNGKWLAKKHLPKFVPILKNKTMTAEELVPEIELARTSTSTPKKSSRSGLFRSLSLSDLHMKTIKLEMLSSSTRTLNTSLRGNLSKGKSLSNLDKNGKKKAKETLMWSSSKKPSSMLSLCESFSLDQSGTINDTRKENLLKLLTWLVRWAEKEDGLKSKRANGPRIKVHLSATQLLSALWTYEDAVPNLKQSDRLSSVNFDSGTESNWSPTEVTPRDFVTSTPVRMPKVFMSRSELPDTLRSRSSQNVAEESLKQHDTGNDLISEYFRRLRLYQHYNDNSEFDSSTLEISSLPSDQDNSLLSVSRSADKNSKSEEHSLVTVTSRWTNSNRTESKAHFVSGSTRGRSTSVDQLKITKVPVSKHVDENLERKDTKKTSNFVSMAVQVHEASLLEDTTSSYPDDSDDTLNEIASPDTTPNLPKEVASQCRLVRRDAVKRVRRKPDDTLPKDGDPELEYYRVPLLQLPAEKELCLLNMQPRTRKKTVNLNSVPPIPRLLHLENSRAPFSVYEEEQVLSMKLLSREELLKYEESALKRKKSSKPPIPPPKPLKFEVEKKSADTKATSVEKQPRQMKVDVGVGCSSVDGHFGSRLRDVQTNTEDKNRARDEKNERQLCDISTNTEHQLRKDHLERIPVKESKSIGVETTNGLVAKEDKATSPVISSQDEQHGNGRIWSLEVQNRKTQTESDDAAKQSVVTRDSQTNTDRFEPSLLIEPDKVTETTRTTQLTVDDSVWKGQLNGAGRNVYRRIQSMDNDAKILKTELIDTKKFLERLELLEQEGILSQQFPYDIALQDTTETTKQQRQNGRDELNEDDGAVRASVCSNSELPDAGQKQRDIVKSELKSWMRRKSSERQKDFREKMDKFRALERVPFTSTREPVTNDTIVKSEEERIRRNKEMATTHFRARKDEALRLLKDLVQDKIPLNTTVSSPITRSSRRRATAAEISSKSLKKEAAENIHNRTYILDRGLIPVKAVHRDHQTKSSTKFDSRQLQYQQYPIRTSATSRPVSYTERLKSLHATPTPTEQFKLTPIKSSTRGLSRSSSYDTVSSWSIPDDVRHILYGTSSDHIPDITDESKEEESWDDS